MLTKKHHKNVVAVFYQLNTDQLQQNLNKKISSSSKKFQTKTSSQAKNFKPHKNKRPKIL